MNRVCHVTTVHPRFDVRIFHKECCSLARNNYDVTLLVSDNQPDEVVRNVKITSAMFRPRNRIERFLQASKGMQEAAIAINADIYHLHDPELLHLGLNLKKIGKTVIFDSHEDYSVRILDREWIPRFIRSSVATVFKMYQDFVVRRLDGVITVSDSFRETFSRLNKHIVVVANYPVLDDSIPSISRSGSDYNASVCFAGAVNTANLHHEVIRSLPDGVKYLLAGKATPTYLRELQALDKWPQVDYLGWIPFERVREVYDKSVVGLVLCDYLSGDPSKMGTQGNTKLFEYMQAGLPVLCTDFVLWKEIVEGNHCGKCVNPHDTEGIANAIRDLIWNPAKSREMGENGRKAVLEKYNWSIEERKLLDLYSTIISNKR